MELVWTALGVNSLLIAGLHVLEKWYDIPIEWHLVKGGIMLQVGIALWKMFGILVTFL